MWTLLFIWFVNGTTLEVWDGNIGTFNTEKECVDYQIKNIESHRDEVMKGELGLVCVSGDKHYVVSK